MVHELDIHIFFLFLYMANIKYQQYILQVTYSLVFGVVDLHVRV